MFLQISLTGPQFLICKMGIIVFLGRIKYIIHMSCLEHCLAHQKGLLSISCITVIITTTVTIYIIFVTFPTILGGWYQHLPPLITRETSNLPKVTKRQKDAKPGLRPRGRNRPLQAKRDARSGHFLRRGCRVIFPLMLPALPSRSPSLAQSAISVTGKGRLSPTGNQRLC